MQSFFMEVADVGLVRLQLCRPRQRCRASVAQCWTAMHVAGTGHAIQVNLCHEVFGLGTTPYCFPNNTLNLMFVGEALGDRADEWSV